MDFFISHALRGVFIYQGKNAMQMTLIKNTDMSATLAYKIARVVYAQTGAASLPGVEALTSMIKNLSEKSGRSIENIISDTEIFDVLDENSPQHYRMNVPANNHAFQMCVRVASRMLGGGLIDSTFGATKFHSADTLPQWSLARGYIADIDGMLFYI